jgi:glycosyltransferase involved in cell wall biosynthesis
LSSLYENFGISPIEALQGGLPLLISRGIYIWEDVKDAAWICNYDVKSVAEQMRIILTDKSLYNYKKSKAIETGNKYKEENLRAQFLEFYKKFNFARIS